MRAGLDWSTHRAQWPNGRFSRFVAAGGLSWHLQEMGSGPTVLLLHGTGASTHSWAWFARIAARRCRLLIPDLPGHGFTSCPPTARLSIAGMAGWINELLNEIGQTPEVVVGHSAGAAILSQMCLDRLIEPKVLVSLNGALLPFEGAHGHLFGHIAKVLASLPFVPRLVSGRLSTRRSVERLIDQVGSRVPEASVECYLRLLSSEKHVAAALGMMANWDLKAFAKQLPGIATRVELIACAGDQAVPSGQAIQLEKLLPNSGLHVVERLGHLGHEEDPEQIWNTVRSACEGAGVHFGVDDMSGHSLESM